MEQLKAPDLKPKIQSFDYDRNVTTGGYYKSSRERLFSQLNPTGPVQSSQLVVQQPAGSSLSQEPPVSRVPTKVKEPNEEVSIIDPAKEEQDYWSWKVP